MMRVYVQGVGLQGPGLAGWPASRAILGGRLPWQADTEPRPGGGMLPATERRRSTPTIRLAVDAAQEALAQSGLAADELATVFACSGGDMEIVQALCEGLAAAEREISPTRFHNSVHNAPAGYWSIATGARLPSTSLSCYDDSFSAGLLEAATQAAVDGHPVLLVAYELPAPVPLHAARPVQGLFGTALVLHGAPAPGALAMLDIDLAPEPGLACSRMAHEALEALRQGNPAARALPLLAALATPRVAELLLSHHAEQYVRIRVTPC